MKIISETKKDRNVLAHITVGDARKWNCGNILLVLKVYLLFLDARCDNALPATLFEFLLYEAFRRILEAVEATFLLVVLFAIYLSSFL